jgi:hypothetical protein
MTNTFVSNLLPIILFFFIGVLFRTLKLCEERDGQFLLKLVFYLFLPAMCFVAIIETEFTREMLSLPLIPIVPVSINFLVIRWLLRYRSQTRPVSGVFYCAGMILNTGFMLPFFTASYGLEGFSRGILFDIGNVFFIFTVIYFVAVQYGHSKVISKKLILKKFLVMPPLLAFLIALIVIKFSIAIPENITIFLDYASQPTIPMIMLSLGLLFSPRLENLKKVFALVSIRLIGGLIIGIALFYLLPLDHISKKVVLLACIAPAGYNTLVFAALEKHDERFAATVVSVSLLLSLIYLPVVMMLISE